MSEPPELNVVDRWEDGVGWFTHPGEGMQRVSHAVSWGDGVWVIDPLDADGLDELLDEFGPVAGVVVALGRHKRDAAQIARRHDVSVHVPTWMTKVDGNVDAPVERFETTLPGTDVRAIPLANNRFWQEVALYDEDGGTLYVPEAIGTGPFFRTGGESLGVNPFFRPFPPRSALGELDPVERVLVGHGKGVLDGADDALQDALAGARRRIPGLLAAWAGGIIGR